MEAREGRERGGGSDSTKRIQSEPVRGKERDGLPKGWPLGEEREGQCGWNGDRVRAGVETSWCAQGRGKH